MGITHKKIIPNFASRMHQFRLSVLLLLVIAALFSGCDPTRKLAKSQDLADRDSAAFQYFRAKKYEQAVFLFEELLGIYRSTPRAEEIFYYYAYCRYHMGELVTAAYYFDEFTVQFPRSKHVEDFSWMSSFCYYKLADPWYLDQAYTKKAIDRLQLFITRYPNSKHKDECNNFMTELRERLARKAYEQASLYYKIGYYKAAVQAFKNVLSEYPDSKFSEQTYQQLVESSHKLAEESIFSKQEERYQGAIEIAEKFTAKYPDDKFVKDAEQFVLDSEKQLEKIAEIKAQEEEAQMYSKFQRNMRTAIDTREPEAEKEAYSEALEIQKEMQEKYTESKYFPQIQKLLADFDKKKEKEARKQKEPEIQ